MCCMGMTRFVLFIPMFPHLVTGGPGNTQPIKNICSMVGFLTSDVGMAAIFVLFGRMWPMSLGFLPSKKYAQEIQKSASS